MSTTVPIFDQEGKKVHLIPEDKKDAAIQAGGQLAFKFKDPATGGLHWIPQNQVDKAKAAGGVQVEDVVKQAMQQPTPEPKIEQLTPEQRIRKLTEAEGQDPSRIQLRVNEYNYAIRQGMAPERAEKFAMSMRWEDAQRKILSEQEKKNIVQNIGAMSPEERRKQFILSHGDDQKWAEGYAEAKKMGFPEDEATIYATSNPVQRYMMRAGRAASGKWTDLKAGLLHMMGYKDDGHMTARDVAEAPLVATVFGQTQRDYEFQGYKDADWVDKRFGRMIGSVQQHLDQQLAGFTTPDMVALEVASLGGAGEARAAKVAGEEASAAARIGKAAGRATRGLTSAPMREGLASAASRAQKAIEEARVPVSARRTARTVRDLAHAGFTAQMTEGAIGAGVSSVESFRKGDTGEGTGYALDALLTGLMVGGSLHHAQAEHKIRTDLEAKTTEVYGEDKKFGKLTDQQQAVVINKLVEDDPNYKKAADASQGQMARQARILNQRYNEALNQAWDKNAAQRAIRMIHEDRAEAARKEQEGKVVAAIKDLIDKRTKEIEARQKRREETEEAYQKRLGEIRDLRPERRAEERARSQQVQLDRKELAQTRETAFADRQRAESERSTFDPNAPRRTVEAHVDGDGHVSYPSEYWGETQNFGVASDGENHHVYRRTERGVEWLDRDGNFSEEPQSLYYNADPKAADTAARIASLKYTADSLAAQDDATPEQIHEAEELSAIHREFTDGTIDRATAQRRARIDEKPMLPDEFTAARDGRLNGPFAERSAANYAEEIEQTLRDSGVPEAEIEATLETLPQIARAQTETNLHQVYKSGDYIVDARGNKWTLGKDGLLHPDNGTAPVPLLKNGRYTNRAVQLAGSGRVGYGVISREARRRDAVIRREVQRAIEQNRAEVERELEIAKQNENLDLADEATERIDAAEKAKRAGKWSMRPPVPEDIQKARKERRAARKLSKDPDNVINQWAKRFGTTPDEIMRIGRALLAPNTVEGKAADLEIGDTISDNMRPDRPWRVESSPRGGLQLRSGNASPLPLDRESPSDRVKQIIQRGSIEKERPLTDDEKREMTFEKGHIVYADFLAHQVEERHDGRVKDPAPRTVGQARAQATAAQRREDASVDAATRKTIKALNPTGDIADEAEKNADAANEAIRTAERAAGQQAEAHARTVPRRTFPQRAQAGIGFRGKEGVIVQNGKELPFHFELIPLQSIQTSHRWDGKTQVPNEGEYPAALQPRTISDKEAEANALRAEPDKYDFRQYADKTINATMGPAVVDQGGFAVGVNTQLEIMRRYLQNLEKIGDPEQKAAAVEGFRSAMRELATESGIRRLPTDTEDYVVVRMLDKPIEDEQEAAFLGRLLNKKPGVEISKAAKGISYSKAFTIPMLEDIGRRVEAYDGITGAMNADPDFFKNIVRNEFGVSQEEDADWFKSKGEGDKQIEVLSEDGQRQFVKALLGKVIENPSLLNRIEDKTPYRALERALGYIVKMWALPDLDISGKVEEALQAAADTQNTDPALSRFNDKWSATYSPDQQDLVGMEQEAPPEPDRMTETLWRALYGSDAATPRVFNDRLKSYIGEETSKGGWIFGEHKETPVERFNRAFAKELKEVAFRRGDKEAEISPEEYDAAIRNREVGEPESLGASTETTEGGRGESPEQKDRRKPENAAYREHLEKMSEADRMRELYYDKVSGIRNRRAFDVDENNEKAPAVAFIDLDGLKFVNDQYGHAAGNELLKFFGEQLRANGLDAYHFHGDEFAIRGDSEEEMKAALEQAREAIANAPLKVGDSVLKGVSFSFGVADTLKAADTAMMDEKAKRKSERGAAGTIKPVGMVKPPEKAPVSDLPNGVMAYGSGANALADMAGHAQAGMPIGVSVPELSKEGLSRLTDLAAKGHQVFLDSGAFSEVEFGPEGMRIAKEITIPEWQKRLDAMLKVAKASKGQGNVTVIAPDRVGDRFVTFERLGMFATEVNDLLDAGATVLLPLQDIANDPDMLFFRDARNILLDEAEGHAPPKLENLVPAFPMNKAATRGDVVLDSIDKLKQQADIRRIHLLGTSMNDAGTKQLVTAIKDKYPDLIVTMDSNRLRAKTDEINSIANQVREEFGEHANAELTANGKTWDYTEAAQHPSEWASKAALGRMEKRLEEVLGAEFDGNEWEDNPDQVIADHGNDWVHQIVEDEYFKHIGKDVASEARKRAVADVMDKEKKGTIAPPKRDLAPPKPPSPEDALKADKGAKGYVTTSELKDFLEKYPATKDHASELMRTARLMAEYVYDIDPPAGVERKEALDWVLRERLSRIEPGISDTKRGEYIDSLEANVAGAHVLRLHKASDATTFIHEFAHIIFPMLSDEDLKAVDSIVYKGTKPAPKWDGKKMSKEVYHSMTEKLAHGLEKFLRDQNPRDFTDEVKNLLAKVKDIFRNIYLKFKGDPLANWELSSDAIEMFDNMFHIAGSDIPDTWRDEVKKARAEEKRLKGPAETPHPLQKLASQLGADSISGPVEGKVADSTGDRVDPKKPVVALQFKNEEEAMTAFAAIVNGETRIDSAEVISTQDGKWAIRFNQDNPPPKMTLNQELPQRHPGVHLEDLEKKLKALPAHKIFERKLLQLQIDKVKNQIRADHGIEERRPPAPQPEIARKAVEEVKRAKPADGVRAVPHAISGPPERPRAGSVPKPPVVGMPRHAGPPERQRGAGRAEPSSLGGVKPVNLLPLAKERGAPKGVVEGQDFDKAKWVSGLKRAGLPENSPAPTYSLNRQVAEKLIFPGQKQIVALAMSALDQGDAFIIGSPTGTGKCLGKGTPVLMADGTILPVEEIRVGDQVMGPDSKPRNVLGLSHGFDRMYRVYPVKGDSYTVNEPHVLSLKITDDGKGWNSYDAENGVVNISVSDYLKKSKTFKHRAKGYKVAIDFPCRAVPMDPYILGLWLGDGTGIRPGITTIDPEVRALWEEHVESLGGRLRKDDSDRTAPEYVAVFSERGKTTSINPVKRKLLELGLIGNKHIPHIYKVNHESTRLKLLAGLIDTDGSLSDGGYDFISKSRALADDVAFVVRSVGLAAYVKPCKKTCTNNGKTGTYYRVSISGDIARIPVQVRRKQARPRKQKKDVLVTGIKVEPIGRGEYFGFEVDGDHLFLLGDFTVTHNSYTAAAIIKEFQLGDLNSRILYVTRNRKLAKKTARVADNSFGFKMDTGVPNDPNVTGVYGTTYAGLRNDLTYKQMKWDLVVFDESGEMRRWYDPDTKQGRLGMDVAANSQKVVWASATPFHSPSEYGYLEKLNLWPKGGFDDFIAENFAHKKVGDKIVAELDPGKQAKFRQQLIERGQMVTQAISYDGLTAHFGVVPVTDTMKRGLDRIKEGFDRARAEFLKKGKKALAEKVSAFEATYTKSFLERERLPQAIEIAKKARAAGYQVAIFSEHSAQDLFRRTRDKDEGPSTYQELDDEMGGNLSKIIPPFSDVYEQLRRAFGEQIGDYSGRGNTDAERDQAIADFLKGDRKMLYSTYAAGGIGVDMHDADFPDQGVKGGDKPRIFLFLGPPYSGVLLDQAMGRGWRFGVKSNTGLVFLATDSEPDVKLMQTKVGPRMQALRAAVQGVGDSLADVMHTYSDEEKMRERQDMLAYDEGNEEKVTASRFQVTAKGRRVGVQDWSAITFKPAETAKNKGMQYGEDVPGGDWSTLYQAKYGTFDQIPDDPNVQKGKETIDGIGNGLTSGQGLPEGVSVQNLDPASRDTVIGAASAVAADGVSVPVETDKEATARQAIASQLNLPGDRNQWVLTWPEKAKVGVWKYLGDPNDLRPTGEVPAELPHNVKTWYLGNISSQEIGIKGIARQAGVREVGNTIVRLERSWQADKDLTFSQLAMTASDILAKHKIKRDDKKAIGEIWDVVEGKWASADLKINQAAADLSSLMGMANDLMAEAKVKIKTPTGEHVEYSDLTRDVNYMPHRIDWDAQVQNPIDGKTYTLREVMGKTFSEKKRAEIIQAIASGSDMTPNQVVDYLNRFKPGTPVLGNVQRARTLNFPIYRKDWETLLGYFDQVGEAIATERNFGTDRSKLNAEIDKIPSVNGRSEINKMFDGLLGPQDWSDFTAKFYNAMIGFEAVSKMTLSAVKVPFHLVHAPLALGGRTLPIAKAAFKAAFHPRELMENASYVGTVARQLNVGDLIGGAEKGLAHFVFEKFLFNAFYKWGRAIAGESARVWMEQHAFHELKKGGRGAEHTRRLLKETMLVGDKAIDDAIANNRWAREDLAKAQVGFANFTMFSDNPLQMPGWARREIRTDSPFSTVALHRALRLTYALQSFSLKTTSILREKLWDEVMVHHNYKPLAYFAMVYPVVGELLRATGAGTKASIQVAVSGNQDKWDEYFSQLQAEASSPMGLLKRYIDNITFGIAWDRTRRLGDSMFDMIGNKKDKSGNFLWQDEVEQDIGAAWSTLVMKPYLFYQEDKRIASAQHERPEIKSEKEEKKLIQFLTEEFPITKEMPEIQRYLHPKKIAPSEMRF